MQLEPCPACQRHVRTDETVCPFCAAPIAEAMANVQPRTLPRSRLGRAALMSFGLVGGGAVVAGLESCGGDDNTGGGAAIYGAPAQPPDAATPRSTPDAGEDAGMDHRAIPLYGAPVQEPIVDASTRDAGSADAGDAGDAGDDAGPPRVFPVYGAPPQQN